MANDLDNRFLSLPNRAIGSQNILLAKRLLQEEISKKGLTNIDQEIVTIKRGFFILPFISCIFLLVGTIFVFFDLQILALAICFLGIINFLQFKMVIKLYKKFIPVSTSNIYAFQKNIDNSKPTLIVSAHYDTVPETIYIKHILHLAKIKGIFAPKIPAITSIFLPFYTAMIVLMLAIFLKELVVFPFLIFSLGILYSLHGLKAKYVSGVLDNGASVVALTKIMNYPVKNLNLISLFSTAEENYVRGVEYVDEILIDKLKLDKSNTYFLNLECLGCKNMTFATSESDDLGLSIVKYSSVSVVKNFLERNKINTGHIPVATDMVKIAKLKYRVIGTLISFDETFKKLYHSKNDSFQNFSRSNLLDNLKVLEKVIDFLDSELS